MIDELSGHLPGLPSLKLSGIGADVTMPAGKGKQRIGWPCTAVIDVMRGLPMHYPLRTKRFPVDRCAADQPSPTYRQERGLHQDRMSVRSVQITAAPRLHLKVEIMIAIIFEVWPADGRKADYLDFAARLRGDLEHMDGFVSIERFQSLTDPGKLLSLSFWRDEAAVAAWRRHDGHRVAQAAGRSGIFRDYRLRVAAVVRDYGMTQTREQAPQDSSVVHNALI
jgi:heme-degrading monooxygenase HmoA